MRQIKLDYLGVSSCLCTFYNNGKANVMVIDSVFTEEKSRCQGYATILMAKALMLARKYNVGAIELVTDNPIAKKFYKRIGFKKTNKIQYRIIL